LERKLSEGWAGQPGGVVVERRQRRFSGGVGSGFRAAGVAAIARRRRKSLSSSH